MIPAAFDYVKASSVDDALAALVSGGEDAKILAGGQSLIPLLRLRLAAPALLVDLTGISEMRGVRDGGDSIVIGAMTTHDTVLNDPLVARYATLLKQATATVADRQVRHRGTFGGSLAHADPAGDLPAVAVASGAVFEIAGASGRRSVPASEFFLDYLTTAIGPDEILTAIRLPKREGWGTHYEKFQRMAQAWAIVGVAAAVQRDGGAITAASIALTNMGSTPIQARAVERALIGSDGSPEAVAAAAAHAVEGTSPTGDVNASAEYRQHLAGVLTRRAIQAALAA
jgi:carbon-monoxide dehydrogenase medium subunit